MIFLIKTKKTGDTQLLSGIGEIQDKEGLRIVFESEDKRKPSYTVVFDEDSREKLKEMLR